MCLVKIHGEEMPGDVESIGAEGGVADMDKIDEIQQLTQLLGVEQATGDAKYCTLMIQALIRRMMETRILKDKDCGGDTLYREN